MREEEEEEEKAKLCRVIVVRLLKKIGARQSMKVIAS